MGIQKCFLLAGILTSVLFGCKKNDTTAPSSPSCTNCSYSFASLTAQSTSIPIGGTTKVTASATGNSLTYSWSASAGDIIGNGYQITYGAPTCCGGTNTVTCTVKDGSGNSQTKSVTITVH